MEGLDRLVTSRGRLFVRSKMNKQSIMGAARRLTELGAQVEKRMRCRLRERRPTVARVLIAREKEAKL